MILSVYMEMRKNMNNLEIAKLLHAAAAAYQVKQDKNGVNRFRVIAYNNAAEAVEHSTSEVKDLWDDGKLDQLSGIGAGITASLDELFRTGKVKHFESIFDGLSPAMFELLEIPGIGAKRALRLTKELGITKAHNAIHRLEEAAIKGRIREMEGFGEQSEKEILEAIQEVKGRTKRLLLPYASMVAGEVLAWLENMTLVKRADPLGSLRRRVSTVGDIDIAVASDHPKEVIEHFKNYPKKVKIVEAGEATATLLLPGSVHVDLMVQPAKLYGTLLQHFTGSKQHNVALRTYAQKKGLSLSERGIKDKNGEIRTFAAEEAFYRALGMDWIPPEIRENDGEIEAALRQAEGKLGGLPDLVELAEIKGDLHMHTNLLPETSHDSGVNTPQEMLAEADRLGYEYIAFTEHNLKYVWSEDKVLDALKAKQEAVQGLNEKLKNKKNGIRQVFNSLEIDIQPSGKLAIPDKGFDYLDLAIASLHSSFRGDKKEQTKRVVEGLQHPKVRIFGHPTGRRLNQREGVDLDWDKIFEFCRANGKWVEINSSPDRLDLPDVLVREAVKRGVKLTINTDSHEVGWMRGMEYGVSVARRGWAEKKDVVNTLTYAEFTKLVV